MGKRVIFTFLMIVVLVGGLVAACAAPAPAPSPTPSPAPTPVPPTVSPTPDTAENGKALFISKACAGCHTIQGIPEAQGKVGPELTHQAGNSLIVDVLSNTEENLEKYLKDPAAVKPGALMPNQNLTDSEIKALVAFLRTLK